MPAANVLRAKQKARIKPLIDELMRLFTLSGKTRLQLAEESGLTNYQVGRILGDYLPAPTYLDITALLMALDLSPNEAAALVGFPYAPAAIDDELEERAAPLNAAERRMLSILRRDGLGPTQRLMLVQLLDATATGLAAQVALEGVEPLTIPLSEAPEQAQSNTQRQPQRKERVAR